LTSGENTENLTPSPLRSSIERVVPSGNTSTMRYVSSPCFSPSMFPLVPPRAFPLSSTVRSELVALRRSLTRWTVYVPVLLPPLTYLVLDSCPPSFWCTLEMASPSPFRRLSPSGASSSLAHLSFFCGVGIPYCLSFLDVHACVRIFIIFLALAACDCFASYVRSPFLFLFSISQQAFRRSAPRRRHHHPAHRAER
jgi:hypothetical protein